ncbi:MAG: helix-turn-helix transcriptional regulator [Rhodospirillales bacterium]|nr:helix-turn-helix transcriptional regulator [Rhodospirillales bacterium]
MVPVSDLAFHQRLARVMEHIGGDGFWPALSAFLRHGVRFDSWVAMIFRAALSPQVLYEGDSDQLEDVLFTEYVSSFYSLDPFYLFSQSAFTPGLYRLDEVAAEHFRKTEYYQRYFALNVFEDEVQFMLPMAPYGVLTLSLGSKLRFTDAEVGLLCLYAPWLLPMMRVASALQISSAGVAPNQGVSLEEQLRRGFPQLTDREVQTAILLLAGHSSKAIAARLTISPETVKVHRRNLYEKLQVSSQAEIFALFMPRE